MDAEVDDGERRQQGVGKHGVAIAIPATVVVKPCEAQPHGKRNPDVKRRHPVGERINASEPVGDFGGEGVGQRFHSGDGVARHSYVEKEVKRYGKDVDPSDGQGHTVGKPTVIKVGEIEH